MTKISPKVNIALFVDNSSLGVLNDTITGKEKNALKCIFK